MTKRRSFVALLLAVLMFGWVPTVFGQTDNQGEERITLSPAVSRPELSAGDIGKGKLTIINDGKTEYEFILYARPFSVKGEQYDPDYTEVNERTEAYQWVQFEKTRLRLEPNQRVEVGYTVTVPENAAPGGHYAVLFAETQPPVQDGSSVVRKKRVGSLLYMRIAGDVTEEGRLASWNVPLFQTKPPLKSDIRLKNGGNVHFQADVQVTYSNLFGKKQFELNQELLIMPGTTRRVPVAWEQPPYFGIFKAKGTVQYLGHQDELAEKWIILFPVPLMAGLAGMLALIVSYRAIKRRQRKKTNATGLDKKD